MVHKTYLTECEREEMLHDGDNDIRNAGLLFSRVLVIRASLKGTLANYK